MPVLPRARADVSASNNFVVASGSYGGIYVPHIATVIHENNLAGTGRPIRLESLMLSNPMSVRPPSPLLLPALTRMQDIRSWYTWHLQHACYNTDLYNATQCAAYFQVLPTCLEMVEFAYAEPSAENKRGAVAFCNAQLMAGDTHGRTIDNVNHKVRAYRPRRSALF